MTRLRGPVSFLFLFITLIGAAGFPASLTVQAQPGPGGDVIANPPEDAQIYEEPFHDRVRNVYPSVVSEITFELTTRGEIIEITTANTSEGGDPFLHLIDLYDGNDVAGGDSGSGDAEAYLVHKVEHPGQYLLVVRSRTPGNPGTTDLFLNGQPWRTGVQFGGDHQVYSELKQGESLEMVHVPNGTAGAPVMYVLNEGGNGLDIRQVGGGVMGAPKFTAPRDIGAIGSLTVILGVRSQAEAGHMRLIRNDAALSDQDGDGLGTGLEATLGTCDSLSGFATGIDGVEFECSLAADARDTDGDGLRDDWEVLGLQFNIEPVVALAYKPGVDTAIPTHEYLTLPKWGADPRHKDLFIEIDFMQRQPNETAQKLQPQVARQFASFYQDELDDPIELVKLYRAVTLRNPDKKQGINVHFDSGVAPTDPADATLYGDWGGYSVVPPVPDGNGGWKGDNYATAWQTYMSENRRGIFRYILAYPTGGGSVGLNSFAAAGPMDNAWVLAHEFGHAMGLDHSGPPKPTIDANCKPNYPSLMNYAYNTGAVGFSDGLGISGINNASVREFEAVSPENTAYLDTLENLFKYYVDREHGHVDWNRDGEIAPEGETVRAYANYRPGGGGCENTRHNQTAIPNAASVVAPAMERLGDRLYVFYSVLGALYYTYSTDAGNCPAPTKDPCATWSDRLPVYMDAQGGVDVVRVGNPGNEALLIVTIDADGNLWEARLALDANGNEVRADPLKLAGSPAAGEPSLARFNGCDVYLAYRGTDNLLHTNHFACTGSSDRMGVHPEGEQLALDQDGNQIAMADYASPGIGRAYLQWGGALQHGIFGAFAAEDGRLDLYWRNPQTGRWEKTDLLEGRPGPVEGRPALAWTTLKPEWPESQGRFYLMYINHDTRTDVGYRGMNREVKMMMSYVKVERDADGQLIKTPKVGLHGPFDNVWFYAFGIDLLFEPGIDTNLRMVDSIAINKPEIWSSVQFRPKADGINDLTYTNANDWEVMALSLCKNLVNPGGTLPQPAVTCAAN